MNFEQLRSSQRLFESNLVGTDGTLEDLNSVQFSLERGVIGEAREALDALALHGMHSEEFRNEVIDVIVFLSTVLNHIDMAQEEIEERTRRIVVKNFIKYHPRNFSGRTVSEGMKHSREIWNKEEETSIIPYVQQQKSIVVYQSTP